MEDDLGLDNNLEDILHLCEQQHEVLTLALRRCCAQQRQVSQAGGWVVGCWWLVANKTAAYGSTSSSVSGITGLQLSADLRTKKPEIMCIEEELPPAVDFEVKTPISHNKVLFDTANSPGSRVSGHSQTFSEWSTPADSQAKALSGRSTTGLMGESQNPLAGLRGWKLYKELIKMRIDYFAGVLVLVNSLMMIVELEIEGHHSGAHLGLSEDPGFHEMEPYFRVIDALFVYIYLFELLLRIVVERPFFHRSVANWFDVVLVLSGLADIYIIAPLANGASAARNIAMLRLFRATKSFRSMRMVRTELSSCDRSVCRAGGRVNQKGGGDGHSLEKR
eukprot:symbB.v1.2.017960.t1/scaffold1414.1/size120338/3